MSAQPLLLCVDAGSPVLLVALCRGATPLAEDAADAHHAHGAAILPMIDDVARRAGVAPVACDALVVALGPGSFTGLRTALATMKGLALGWGKPLVGVATLQALARSTRAAPGTVVAAALDARKGQVYAAVYRLGTDAAADELLHGPVVTAPEAWAAETAPLHATLGAGDGWARYPALGSVVVRWHNAFPAAGALAEIALPGLASPPPLATLDALYVRRSYVELGLGTAARG
ncbi:MAG: tRNA (adenosine(37)-N6)-threonylcarbamoyltransferase complex dimerization subunit type 1 TsaB [Deltaproteobacteria bacterium]|nr:tRNA (adenosine(37)-N6)-threonylcarbamoyltransferase complex dimerization subunit type 1 TsaB [Deltaproteobacteria bacterium]